MGIRTRISLCLLTLMVLGANFAKTLNDAKRLKND